MGRLTYTTTTETVTTTTYTLGGTRVTVKSTLNGQHFGVVHDRDGQAVMGANATLYLPNEDALIAEGGERVVARVEAGRAAATPGKAFALALSEALDSSTLEWSDVDASITEIMLSLVVEAYGVLGDHENTGGGTMCATWISGDHVAVMGDDDCTVGFYVDDLWANGLPDGSTAEPYALSDSTDFGSALAAIGRFLGRDLG